MVNKELLLDDLKLLKMGLFFRFAKMKTDTFSSLEDLRSEKAKVNSSTLQYQVFYLPLFFSLQNGAVGQYSSPKPKGTPSSRKGTPKAR